MAAKGLSTIGTWLKINGTFWRIKSYPDLFGTPDQIEITDQEDTMQKFVPGVKTVDSMEFTMNYLPNTFGSLRRLERSIVTSHDIEILFGDKNGKDGRYFFKGALSVRIAGGDVNAPRDMVLTVFPDTDIKTVIEKTFGPFELTVGGTELNIPAPAEYEAGTWIKWSHDRGEAISVDVGLGGSASLYVNSDYTLPAGINNEVIPNAIRCMFEADEVYEYHGDVTILPPQ